MQLSPLKLMLAMADGMVENCLIQTWQDGLILEICLGIISVNSRACIDTYDETHKCAACFKVIQDNCMKFGHHDIC